ncbi:Hypothetical protein SRAE_1000357200 [Strongyloides ratti]|uniref:Uncharacterized protein n=1 Tax=Strongyloides ratti TaxID=34506 RepID=A0A090MXF0_STRRB|nr:Hypothetical protein SRAE_1000357200 [Strongyloides ratti]CEF65319.1 Hypothetical protein SRAE_1000357200 [Strongyloides ratti]
MNLIEMMNLNISIKINIYHYNSSVKATDISILNFIIFNKVLSRFLSSFKNTQIFFCIGIKKRKNGMSNISIKVMTDE